MKAKILNFIKTDTILVVSGLLAVISCSRHNLYGHPSPEVLARLEAAHCRIWGTYEDGCIVYEGR